MLEAAGYPKKTGAMTAVSKRVNVPHQTLGRWFRQENNPPPAELVQEKKRDLIKDLTALLHLSIDKALMEAGEASYRELSTGIGIFIDKLQLLTGQPTERTEQNVTVSETERKERLIAIFDELDHRRPIA